jgi:hypothetical protein
MAKPTVTISDVDELEKSVKDLTSLSQSLRDVFTKINRETDVLGQGFRNIVAAARTNANLAERYLTSQRLQEAVQSRINEIKSKSSFLDSVGLQFKREETQLQMRIAAAQIRALQSQIAIQGINNRERLRAIEALRIQNVLRGAELRYVTTSTNNQSQVVASLNAQLTAIQEFTPTLQRNNTILGTFKEIGKDIASNMGDFGKYLSGTVPTWKDIIVKGVKMFMEFDKAGFTLRKSFGLLRGDFDVLEKNVKTLAIDLADLGVTFDGVVLATTAIGKEFNTLVASNKDLVKDVSVLSVQLGIAETESAKFLKSISGMSRSTAASQKGMIGFAKAMANAAGVPLDAVMKDVADASDEVRIYTGSSVVNLIKGAAEARMMGTTFQKMADTAKKLLDFNTSITDEIEASVLLGTNVTFQRARELAYKKDILGANKEILKIAKGMDFDAMDPFQAEAFAKASGKTVTELQEMVQADKELNYIRMNGTVEQKAQLALMDDMKRMRDVEAKDIGKQAERSLRQQANQERINQLQNQFNQLMMELAKPVMDVVEPLLKLFTFILPPILQLIKLITLESTALLTTWVLLIKPISAVMTSLYRGGAAMNGISNSFRIFTTFFSKGLGTFGLGFFGRFSGLFGTISKFLGPIGLVINAFMFLNNLVKRFNEFVGTDGIILGGLKAVGYAIYDTLIQPFVDAFKWIKEKSGFMANSPSKVGLGIYDGIVSIGPSLSDAITEPFKNGYDNISKLSSNAKLPIFNGVINNGVGTNIPTDTTNDVSSNENVINQASIIGAIKQGIKEGIGSITMNVNLDGQKIITGISKNVGFRLDSGGVAMQTSLT